MTPQPWPPYAQQAVQPRKRRRVFIWVFLAVQVLFVVWLIAGIASGHGAAVHCHDQYLTHAQCASASEAGTAIGVGIIVLLWVAADLLLFIPWAIWRLARR